MSGEKDLNTLIRSMKPTMAPQTFVFSTIKRSLADSAYLNPIASFQEAEGLTLVLLKETADQHSIHYDGLFKCITLNVHSSLDAVGLTAAVATKLTEQGISANVIAAYYHDHVFVAVKDADNALSALQTLTAER